MRILSIIILLCFSNLLVAQCEHPDYDALMKIFEDYNGENWTDNNGWKEGFTGSTCDPCDFNEEPWFGLSCAGNRVFLIDLSYNNLEGQLTELGELEFLRTLNLSGNSITGPIVDFENLPELRTLRLSENQLEGTIPNFSNIPELTSFYAYNNSLSGMIPEFGNSSSIRAIDLCNNQLSGNCPNFSKLPKLEILKLDDNLIEGPLPDFSNCSEMYTIMLSNNKLIGEIPTFENLTELVNLHLDENLLEGPFPNFDDHKTKLETIEFSKNNLSGELPSVSGLTSLDRLCLDRNNFEGTLSFLYQLPELFDFSIEHNLIKDTLPSAEQLANYRNFNAGNNKIHGEIKEDLELLTWQNIRIDTNNLSGCIPEWLCSKNIFIDGNALLPFHGVRNEVCIQDFSDENSPCDSENGLGEFYVIDDNCECVPVEPCFTDHPDLDALLEIYNSTDGDNWTNNNGWKAGSLGYSCNPCNWRKEVWYGVTCDSMERVVCIDLDGFADCTFTGTSGNNLKGTFPAIKLDKLETLILDHNKLYGPFPSLENLPSLQRLWFSFNEISGTFPSFNNDSLEEVRCSNNYLEGLIPDFDLFPNLLTFTGSNNSFIGCYPESLCNLELYDLKNNPFLPWNGNASTFCDGEEQIGAPCNGNSGTIQDDCICSNLTTIQENDNSPFSVFPNPANEKLFFDVQFKNEIEFEIFNSKGQLLKKTSTEKVEIDIRDLKGGLHFIKIKTDLNEFYTRRFIKMYQ